MKMIKLKGIKVFISSPRDLKCDRKKVRTFIHQFNWFHALKEDKIFIPFSSKEVSGGTGRGQEVINRKLDGVGFLIVMFYKRWGTPTGTEEYDSGTYEEYKVGMKLKSEGKLENILVLFKAESDDDPGDQLKQVRKFKKEIQEKNEVLHKPFSGDIELSYEIESFLTEALSATKGDVIQHEEKVNVTDIKEPSEI